jgi:hypothetical protein
MPTYLVSHSHADTHDRYAVHAANSAEALAKVRTAHPAARGRLRVDVSAMGDVLELPKRGRPPGRVRTWAEDNPALAGVTSWADIR